MHVGEYFCLKHRVCTINYTRKLCFNILQKEHLFLRHRVGISHKHIHIHRKTHQHAMFIHYIYTLSRNRVSSTHTDVHTVHTHKHTHIHYLAVLYQHTCTYTFIHIHYLEVVNQQTQMYIHIWSLGGWPLFRPPWPLGSWPWPLSASSFSKILRLRYHQGQDQSFFS